MWKRIPKGGSEIDLEVGEGGSQILEQQLISILYLVGLFVLFYFLLIRPQQVRQKRHLEMIRNLKVDDRVITTGGIFGTIVKIKEDTVVLRVADNVRIEVLKQAIAQVRERDKE